MATEEYSRALMDMTKRYAQAYDVGFPQILASWGVGDVLGQITKLMTDNPPYTSTFMAAWVKMLEQNLESAIWCCIYHRMRLENDQKTAMKLADDGLKSYLKERLNVAV